YGSGTFVDDGAVATIQNELVVGNVCPGGPGAGIYVDGLDDESGSEVTLVNVTIANHDCPGDGNALLVERASTVTVVDSILWGNGSGLAVDATSPRSVRHSSVEDGAPGEGNPQVDPQFGDPANGDFHRRNEAGRPDPQGACVTDATTSPCRDAGDPASNFA